MEQKGITDAQQCSSVTITTSDTRFNVHQDPATEPLTDEEHSSLAQKSGISPEVDSASFSSCKFKQKESDTVYVKQEPTSADRPPPRFLLFSEMKSFDKDRCYTRCIALVESTSISLDHIPLGVKQEICSEGSLDCMNVKPEAAVVQTLQHPVEHENMKSAALANELAPISAEFHNELPGNCCKKQKREFFGLFPPSPTQVTISSTTVAISPTPVIRSPAVSTSCQLAEDSDIFTSNRMLKIEDNDYDIDVKLSTVVTSLAKCSYSSSLNGTRCGEKHDKSQHVQERKIRISGNVCTVQCGICKETFTSEESLMKHRNVVHSFKCDLCLIFFPTKADLISHIHCGTCRFKCNRCSKFFSSISYLKVHSLSHSEIGPSFKCNICKKMFYTDSTLKVHRLIHSEARPLFKCKICNKMFASKYILKTHSLIHLNLKKSPLFKCGSCEKLFATQGILKSHSMIHSEIRPLFTCRICNKMFTTRGILKTHTSSMHSKINSII